MLWARDETRVLITRVISKMNVRVIIPETRVLEIAKNIYFKKNF